MRYLAATARPILEDLAGTVAFYLLYLATESTAIAGVIGLGVGFLQIGAHLYRRERVPTLLLIGVALTAILGSVSVATRDPRFLLLKPSVIYTAVGLAMLPRGWLVRYVPAIAAELLPSRTIDRAGWGWAALILNTAALNVALVTALPPARAAAVFATVALSSKLALFAAQYFILRRMAKARYIARLQSVEVWRAC